MKNFMRKAAAFVSAGAMALTGVPSVVCADPNITAFAVDDCNDDWLHCEGSRIYDMNGNEVWLTGANWFGLNCTERCPHYLYAGDCDDMLRECAERGINVIRFPVSTELLYEWQNGLADEVPAGGMQASCLPPKDEDDGNGGIVKAGTYGCINKDFVKEDGKTRVNTDEAFDIILSKCKKYGIKAFVDVHSPHADNSGHNYNLWYGKEMTDNDVMVTTDLWIETLTWLAEKYKNDDTLIGYDLKNEPHGKGPEGKLAAKWDDSDDENNWAKAATKCAESILSVNPNALIFVEGVEQSMSGAKEGDYWGMPDRVVMNPGDTPSPYIGAWWGGNFRGARKNPIVPKQGTSQIVYSPHDYGPSVYAQTWFEKDFNEQTLLDDYWFDTWAYINAEDIGPELIGEWGGHMEGKNLKWMTLLRDYMIKHHINHTFWCLNTNSGDTGGLWAGFSFNKDAATATSNGTTITWEEDKYELMEKALWQTATTGKYIGLDHQRPLGSSATGLSLNEFYTSYANTEGSNLDGGKKGNGQPVIIDGSTTTTTVTTTTTTVTTSTTDKPTGDDDIKWGDANCDGDVNMADAVLIMQSINNPDKYGEGKPDGISSTGVKNADVFNTGDGITNKDALAIQKYKLGIIGELPEKQS